MLDRQTFATLYRFNVGYFHSLVRDFPEEALDAKPVPEGNTPRWIIGHVVTAQDLTLSILGRGGVAPPRFGELFSPGAVTPAGELPTKGEILDVFDRGVEQIADALAGPLPDGLDAPHGLEILSRSNLKTKAELLAHLLTTHFATHVGQLSTLRRMAGHPPLF